MGWSEPYWPMISGPLMMIIFVITCLGVMLFIVRVMIHRFRDRTPDILKERLARGETSQTEYEKQKRIQP